MSYYSAQGTHWLNNVRSPPLHPSLPNTTKFQFILLFTAAKYKRQLLGASEVSCRNFRLVGDKIQSISGAKSVLCRARLAKHELLSGDIDLHIWRKYERDMYKQWFWFGEDFREICQHFHESKSGMSLNFVWAYFLCAQRDLGIGVLDLCVRANPNLSDRILTEF